MKSFPDIRLLMLTRENPYQISKGVTFNLINGFYQMNHS